MKKTTIRLGQMLILSCVIFINYSCKPYSDCYRYEITPQETAFLSVYNTGDIAVFRNDTTGGFDTLHVTQKGYGTGSYENCNQVNDVLNAFFTFSNINGAQIQIIHNEPQLLECPITLNF
jgi:hypothetical protein